MKMAIMTILKTKSILNQNEKSQTCDYVHLGITPIDWPKYTLIHKFSFATFDFIKISLKQIGQSFVQNRV